MYRHAKNHPSIYETMAALNVAVAYACTYTLGGKPNRALNEQKRAKTTASEIGRFGRCHKLYSILSVKRGGVLSMRALKDHRASSEYAQDVIQAVRKRASSRP